MKKVDDKILEGLSKRLLDIDLDSAIASTNQMDQPVSKYD